MLNKRESLLADPSPSLSAVLSLRWEEILRSAVGSGGFRGPVITMTQMGAHWHCPLAAAGVVFL